MVCVSRALLRKYGNFVDNLRVYAKGGTGGMGLPRLGGEGGKGGDVWIVAKGDITLKKIKDRYPHKRFAAGVGGNSSIRALKGEKGKDCIIHAPVGISVTSDDGEAIGELNKMHDRILVARGGQGGSFRTDFNPVKGQTKVIRLDLKLIADIGLVGFPNAGKSSLLCSVSHAKPQVANYAFTTVKPELGKIMYEDHRQVAVADLPGLIEGAHINKGMGHKFLKHIERTKQLLFVVDVFGFQLSTKTPFRTAFETIQLLTKELELYKEELLTKPAILAVNKMDLPNAEDKLNELMKQLEHPADFLHLLPEDMIPETPAEFKCVLPISASTGLGVNELKVAIRKSLEDQYEMEHEKYQKEKLQSLQTMGTDQNFKRHKDCNSRLEIE